MEGAVCFFIVLSSNIMQNIYKLFNKNNDATTLWSNIKLHQKNMSFLQKKDTITQRPIIKPAVE